MDFLIAAVLVVVVRVVIAMEINLSYFDAAIKINHRLIDRRRLEDLLPYSAPKGFFLTALDLRLWRMKDAYPEIEVMLKEIGQ